MSQSSWHRRVERSCRASCPEEMSYPLFKFKPLDENEDRVGLCMSFPSSIGKRYSILRTDSGLGLIDANVDNGLGVIVNVDGESQVRLQVWETCEVPVRINGQLLLNGRISMPLQSNDRVKVGENVYVLCRIRAELGELRKRVKDLLKCRMCERECQDPRLLKCGHSFCNLCLAERIRAALNAPNIHIQHQLPEGVWIAAERDEILHQTKLIACEVCHRTFSCWEAQRAYRPKAVSETMSMMRGWVYLESLKPKCAGCENARCIVSVMDYEYCESCRSILCPVCTVEMHRDHQLRPKSQVLKEFHQYNKVLAAKKSRTVGLQMREKALSNKLDSAAAEVRRLVNNMAGSVNTSTDNCNRMIERFDTETNALEDRSQEIYDRFQIQLNKSAERIKKIDEAVVHLLRGLDELGLSVEAEAAQEAKTYEEALLRLLIIPVLQSMASSSSSSCSTSSTAVNSCTAVAIYDDQSRFPLDAFAQKYKIVRIGQREYKLRQSWSTNGVAGVVWDASIVLAEYFASKPELIEGKRILELGAGTGLPSMVAVQLGARGVTCTDLPSAIPLLKRNVRTNLDADQQRRLQVDALIWGRANTDEFLEEHRSEQDGFDLLIGADVVYNEEVFDDLLQTLIRVVDSSRRNRGTTTKVILSMRLRYERDRKFLCMVKGVFERVEEVQYDEEKDIRIYMCEMLRE